MQKLQVGITPPISTKQPEEFELKATEKLIEELGKHGQYESKDEVQNRYQGITRKDVLAQIASIFKEFVKQVSIRNGLPEELASDVGGTIFTFGSYRLGVHGQGSDIDTLCIAPKYVKREDFLEHMYEALKSRPEVSEITVVPEAFVPIIKLVFSDIHIDLVFARLNTSRVEETPKLLDDSLLRNMDDRCVRSLNGSRVTDAILDLVPNRESFRTALRCIKVWAKKRAIYSNVMGFFGGVAWAIVVARVCQMFPNAAAAAIVAKFFRIMHDWSWPQPVLLKMIEDGNNLNLRVWNPKLYPQDKSHRMPVITPAYPSMCSTHNVTQSTQIITTEEFGRAAEIADKILLGQESWSALFQRDDFFHRYKYYLQVVASSNSADAQIKWAGLVESRLRQLVMKLELVENLELAHPYMKGFEKNITCYTEQEKHDSHHGIFHTEKKEDDNGEKLDPPVEVWTTRFYVGLGIKPKDPSQPASSRKLDFTWPIKEFTKQVQSWDQFDEESMGIVIKSIRSAELPLDVYDESEVARVLKKRNKKLQIKSSNGTDEPPTSKKRKAAPEEEQPKAEVKVEEVTEAAAEEKKEEVPSQPKKEGTLSYLEAVQSQGAAIRTGNYGGLSAIRTTIKKAPEIKMKFSGPNKYE